MLHELVTKADFLLENFRPGTLEKWGCGYDELAKINPRLIMIRVSGYGQSGPYSKRAGFGAVGEAMGGLRYVVGDPSTPPSRMGISIGDSLAATFACLGALSALHHREVTGRGQVVDSAIYEAVLNMMESLITEYDKAGYIRERTGAILPNIAPSNVYPTSDGSMVLIAANQDTVFQRLTQAMGRAGALAAARVRDARRARRTAEGDRLDHRRLDAHEEVRGGAGADGGVQRSGRAHLPRARDAGGPAFPGARGDRLRAASGFRRAEDAERRAEAVAHAWARALAESASGTAQR